MSRLSRSASAVCAILSVSLLLWTSVVWAKRPVIVVGVEAQRLPRHFRSDPVKLQQIITNLERKAVEKLNGEFPLFDWAPRGLNPSLVPDGIITMFLVKGPGAGGQILLACKYAIGTAAPKELPIEAKLEFYSEIEPHPYIEQLVDDVTRRGERVLTTLTAEHESWRQFIRQVRLADQLLTAANQPKLLVIPVLHEELQAAEESIIRVELVVVRPGKTPENATFNLSPGGPVHGPIHTGWQECTIREFVFGGEIFKRYVDQVSEVIERKASVVVRAQHYVKRDSKQLVYQP